VFNYYSKFYSFAESTVRNCEPCGTNLIPYPLSTSPNCGDPMYFSFYCNNSSGQVSFKAPSGTYRVATINPSTRKFVIQVKHADKLNARNSGGNPQLNQPLPFNATMNFTFFSNFRSEVEAEVEITPAGAKLYFIKRLQGLAKFNLQNNKRWKEEVPLQPKLPMEWLHFKLHRRLEC
jgi:hypothetical protein